MRVIISLLTTAVSFFSLAATLYAAPEIRVLPSRTSVQKGTIFEIRIEIAAREAISNISVAPLVPYGFTLEAIPSPGFEVDKEKKKVTRISHLDAGSSLAIVFQGSAPNILGQSRVSTAEAKTFAFNVFYEQDGESTRVPGSQVVSTTIQYTTHISVFLLAGLVGTILGHLIKTGVKTRDDLLTTRGSTGTVAALKQLLGTNVTGLVTILTIGFGALLVLAKGGVPVGGWDQAIALGIGLAVLTDDELLAKLKGKA